MAFIAPIIGTQLSHSKLNRCTRRASFHTKMVMGDSLAPVIKINDTKDDATSSVSVQWAKVDSPESLAVQVTAQSAFAATLMGRKGGAAELPLKSSTPPDGVSPADFYFPPGKRNIAPVVSMVYNEKVSVSMDEINPKVAGVEANAPDKANIAFWKAKKYKYFAPEAPAFEMAQGSEPISTAAFEKYFPSKVRNIAPEITMRAPKGDWDKTAFLSVGQKYVKLNPTLARGLSVEVGSAEPSPNAAAVVANYFPETLAPFISIDEKAESVTFEFKKVAMDEIAAENLRASVANV